MFNFLKSKNSKIFDKFYNKSKNQLSLFNENEILSKQGQFEVLIFCAYSFLNNPNFETQVKIKYLKYLINLRKDYEVPLSSQQTIELINLRLNYIQNQFKNSSLSTNNISGGMYHIFYENPLTLVPEVSFDIPAILKCNLIFSQIVKNLSLMTDD